MLENGLLILVIILILLTILLIIFCIPILIQIWRVSKDMTVTLQTLNQSLPSILKIWKRLPQMSTAPHR